MQWRAAWKKTGVTAGGAIVLLAFLGAAAPETETPPAPRYAWRREPALGDCYGFDVAETRAARTTSFSERCHAGRVNTIAICWDERHPPREASMRARAPLCVYKDISAAACLLSNYGEQGPNPGRMFTCDAVR